MDRTPRPDATRRWSDLVDLLTTIRGRAQATRRRVQRVDRLNRAHIAADLALIEARADKMVALLLATQGPAATKPGEEVAIVAEAEVVTPQPDPSKSKGTAPDRRLRDGAAGDGDMLGARGGGAGDLLGPDVGVDDVEGRPSPNQHSFAGEEFATDTARHYHGPDDSA